jgi:hypothetical protein
MIAYVYKTMKSKSDTYSRGEKSCAGVKLTSVKSCGAELARALCGAEGEERSEIANIFPCYLYYI